MKKRSVKSCLRQSLNANHIEHISTWRYVVCACASLHRFSFHSSSVLMLVSIWRSIAISPFPMCVDIPVTPLCFNFQSSGYEHLQRVGGTVKAPRLLQAKQLITDCAQDQCFVSGNRGARNSFWIRQKYSFSYDIGRIRHQRAKEKSVKSWNRWDDREKSVQGNLWTNLNNCYNWFFCTWNKKSAKNNNERRNGAAIQRECSDRTNQWF